MSSKEEPSQRVIADVEEAMGRRESILDKMTRDSEYFFPFDIPIPQDFIVDLCEITTNEMGERAFEGICEPPTLDDLEDVSVVLRTKMLDASFLTDDVPNVPISYYENDFLQKWLVTDAGNDEEGIKRNTEISRHLSEQFEIVAEKDHEKNQYLDQLNAIVGSTAILSHEEILTKMVNSPDVKNFKVDASQLGIFEQLVGQYIFDIERSFYPHVAEPTGPLKQIVRSLKNAKAFELDNDGKPVVESVSLTGSQIINMSAFFEKMKRSHRVISESKQSGEITAFIQKLMDDYNEAPTVIVEKGIKGFISRISRQKDK